VDDAAKGVVPYLFSFPMQKALSPAVRIGARRRLRLRRPGGEQVSPPVAEVGSGQ